MMMKRTGDNVIVTTSLEKTGNASGLIVTRTFTEMGCNVVSIVFYLMNLRNMMYEEISLI